MPNIVLFPLLPSTDGGAPKVRFDIRSMTLSQLEGLRDALVTLNEALHEGLQSTNAFARATSRLIHPDDPA